MSIDQYRQRMKCSVERIDEILPGCMAEALEVFSPAGIDGYLEGADAVCGLGRGTELVLIFLEGMPTVARHAGEAVVPQVVDMARTLSATANGTAIHPFLATLPACARRLEAPELFRDWLRLVERMAREGKEGLIPLLQQVGHLLDQLTIGGLRNWVGYGLRVYKGQPHRIGDYFSLQSPDSRAALVRERHGTLYADHERRLDLYLRAFWNLEEEKIHPYSQAFDLTRRRYPRLDKQGFHLPDVYDAMEGNGGVRISGLDRYRATLAHLVAHRLWTKPFIADNYNRFQHVPIEAFEDARVEHLAMQRYPGLRRLWLALHPIPTPGECPEGWSCIRHLCAMLSRALLDPDHPYTDPTLLEYVAEFHRRLAADPYDTTIATDLGVRYLVAIHQVDFRSPKVFFKDTVVDYRDDNSYLWIFLEDTDEEDEFHSDHAAANPRRREQEEGILFAMHHPEWDYASQGYRPDWATVYESIHPTGNPAEIDALLAKNSLIAKRLKRIVDLLKPQQKVRIRFQEEGEELDLDVALRALIDYRSGTTPDPRIHQSHRSDGRDIAVLLLIDLSASVNETPEGSDATILQLSREAVALLGWAIDRLGDDFAVAGFASNTRHEVRYLHFKGFGEPWGDQAKARLAAMAGGYSTRMGAAIRHAGRFLARRRNEKRLLLVLTDGEPHDIDVQDGEYLKEDTRKAVEENGSRGVATYCISLDPHADEYVQHLFGRNYTVIDRVERLPERLPRLFMSLTR